MAAIMKMNKNLTDVLDSSIESLKDGYQKTLSRTLKWTLHPSGEDAVSEAGRGELVFLMLVNALATLDTEMSGILLKEVDRWIVFPRITRYMAGKLEAEWRLPKHILDRASKFAHVLELSGLFTVPPELRAYLAELLAKVEESSVGGQASGGEPQQIIYRQAARRRRSRKQGGRGQKDTQATSHQQELTPPPQPGRTITEPSPGPSKIQTSTSHQHTDRPTGAITKMRQVATAGCQTEDPPTSAAVQVASAGCQTEESPTSAAVQVTKEVAQRQLWEGVRKDDGVLIEEAVAYGADLEEREGGWTALTEAASEGRLEAVRALLKLGAELEGKGGWWQGTAVHWASVGGHEAVVRLLVEAGASLRAEDEGKWTPLHAASAGGHLSTVRLLVDAGADLKHRNVRGRTPLAEAQYNRHSAVAAYLRSVGATGLAMHSCTVHISDLSGELPITYFGNYIL